jgi:alkanesulfonate monooxygenase SsuD/methylene tetrahydromethanopterin reductase-like flavin-dependent oxidoreductase (luciferase family)
MTQFGYTAMGEQTPVTCPAFRYHPAVVAQQAATVGVLSSGRFTLGPGAGENLNEHVVGKPWPMARVRQERLEEAVDIIKKLCTGEYVNYEGKHFQVERAKLYDLPDQPPPIGIAVSGPASENVTEDDIAELVPCGPGTDQYVKAVRQYTDAGFTHVALVQVGAENQRDFIEWAASDLLPALRENTDRREDA